MCFQVTSQPSPPHVGEPPYAQPIKPVKPPKPQLNAAGQVIHRTAAEEESATFSQVDGRLGPEQGQQLNNLEHMLGDLSSDMSRQGITTVPKGHCAKCAKPIIGQVDGTPFISFVLYVCLICQVRIFPLFPQVITGMGKIWHPEHFTCSHCKEELGTQNFFERDGQPYCERDYHNLFSPRCAGCGGPILDVSSFSIFPYAFDILVKLKNPYL